MLVLFPVAIWGVWYFMWFVFVWLFGYECADLDDVYQRINILARSYCCLLTSVHYSAFSIEWFSISVQLPHAQATEPLEVNEEKCSHGHEYLAMGVCSGTERSKKRLEYECPYCHVTIYSTVESGRVAAAGHCGKRFRVQSGVVARSFAMHAPNVASRFNLLRRVAEYKARTKRQKERHVPNKLGHQITSKLVGRRLETSKHHRNPVRKRLKTLRLQASHQVSKGAFKTPKDKEKAALGPSKNN